MARNCHIGLAISSQVPQFDRLVHRPRCKLAEIFWIEGQCKDKVLVLLESARQNEILLIVPELDLGVVGATDDEWFCGMHQYAPDKV